MTAAWSVYVYRDGGTPCYVGMTNEPDERRRAHRRRSPWCTSDLTYEIAATFTAYRPARDHERSLIHRWQPRHNRVDVLTDAQRATGAAWTPLPSVPGDLVARGVAPADVRGSGVALRDLRVSAGLAQHELAELLDMDRSTITHVEHGRRAPTVTHLLLSADLFGVQVEDLVEVRLPAVV